MKKIITIIVTIVIVMCGAFMVKGYYNDRYVASDSFYTQIPLDEVNEDSWLVNKDGVNPVSYTHLLCCKTVWNYGVNLQN